MFNLYFTGDLDIASQLSQAMAPVLAKLEELVVATGTRRPSGKNLKKKRRYDVVPACLNSISPYANNFPIRRVGHVNFIDQRGHHEFFGDVTRCF
jgi:hypothetical protein